MRTTLFLDDCPNRCKSFRSNFPSATIVNDADSCIEQLKSQAWDQVFLDHDLGGATYQDQSEKNSGSEVVRWILQNKPEVGLFICHSLNAPARENMFHSLKGAGFPVGKIPFGSSLWKGIIYGDVYGED